MKLVLIILSMGLLTVANAKDKYKHNVKSFSKAKKILRTKIYKKGKTFYCNCDVNDNKIDIKACGYVNTSNYPNDKPDMLYPLNHILLS